MKIFLWYLEQQCSTPDQKRGICIDLRRCTSLFNLIRKPNLSIAERNFLRDSQCAYVNYPWVMNDFSHRIERFVNFSHRIKRFVKINEKLTKHFFFLSLGLLSNWNSNTNTSTNTIFASTWWWFANKWLANAWNMWKSCGRSNCGRWRNEN